MGLLSTGRAAIATSFDFLKVSTAADKVQRGLRFKERKLIRSSIRPICCEALDARVETVLSVTVIKNG